MQFKRQQKSWHRNYLVPGPHEGVVRQIAEFFIQRWVHVCRCAFKEFTAAANEQHVPREHVPHVVRAFAKVRHVPLGVARSQQASHREAP